MKLCSLPTRHSETYWPLPTRHSETICSLPTRHSETICSLTTHHSETICSLTTRHSETICPLSTRHSETICPLPTRHVIWKYLSSTLCTRTATAASLWCYGTTCPLYMMPQEIIPLTLHTMPSFHSCYVSEGDNLSFSSPLCRCLMMLYFSLHWLCQCTVEVTTDTTMEINGYNNMLILSCRTQVLLILVLSDLLLLITREMTTHITTSLFLAKGGATPY